MRSFENIAKLIRNKRLSHPKGYSQSELSHLLGYKNGQFISNVERALCNIPLKMLPKICEILDIDRMHLKETILKDQERTLDIYLSNNINVLSHQEHITEDENEQRPEVAPSAENAPSNFTETTYRGNVSYNTPNKKWK